MSVLICITVGQVQNLFSPDYNHIYVAIRQVLPFSAIMKEVPVVIPSVLASHTDVRRDNIYHTLFPGRRKCKISARMNRCHSYLQWTRISPPPQKKKNCIPFAGVIIGKFFSSFKHPMATHFE